MDSKNVPLEIPVKESRRAQQQGVPLVDIRTADEQQAGSPEGSIKMSAQDVLGRVNAEPGWRCNLICAGGARSLVLAARLRSLGAGRASSVAGGFERWMAFNSIALLNSPVATEETAPPPIPIR